MQRDAELSTPQEVLYVEDHPTNVRLMRALFEQLPHLALVVAGDGRQALELAPRLQPRLLLLDLRLPDCHGAALLAALRGRRGWATLPAVAVTAERAFRIEGTSFCELWAKPLDLGHVRRRLDALTRPPALMGHEPERWALPSRAV